MLDMRTTIESAVNGDRVDPVTGEERLAPPRLLQYWHLLQRWKFVIIAIVIGSVAFGLVATMLMTRKYTATARVEISREQKQITNVQGLESDEVGRDIEFYQTQYALLKARSLAERVAQTLALQNDAAFFEAHGSTLEESSLLGSKPLSVTDARKTRLKRAVDLLLLNISIEPIRGSSLVDVRYVSASPAVSAKVANAWAQQFIRMSVDRRFASTADARKFLETRLSELLQRLEKSEGDLVTYARNRGIVTLSVTEGAGGKTRTESTLLTEDLNALNEALNSATSERISAQSKAQQTRAQGASQEALLNTAISAMRDKRAEAAGERAKLLVQFEPGYPAVKALGADT